MPHLDAEAMRVHMDFDNITKRVGLRLFFSQASRPNTRMECRPARYHLADGQAGLGFLADMTWEGLDRALLVGGSTHMPMTRQLMRDLSGKEPETGLAVSEVVARGAALHAGVRAARLKKEKTEADAFGDVVEIHVNAHGLGVEVRHQGDRINDVLIPKNTQLPAGGTRVYRTTRDGQEKVRVKIMQGDARQAAACIAVGECWIEDLPAGLPAGSPVEVTCGCGDNGLIEVTARDIASGKTVRAELHREGGLSDEDIQRERQWLESMTIL